MAEHIPAEERAEPGCRKQCPNCGRHILIRKDGTLRTHFRPDTYYHCLGGGRRP